MRTHEDTRARQRVRPLLNAPRHPCSRRRHCPNRPPFGAAADAVFELVFNTSMTGYQEILTDPSYHGQVLFTVSHIGNVGINAEDYNRLRRRSLPWWCAA